MKIEILVDGLVVSTQTDFGADAAHDVLLAKKLALQRAIENNELRISQALKAHIRVIDDFASGSGPRIS